MSEIVTDSGADSASTLTDAEREKVRLVQHLMQSALAESQRHHDLAMDQVERAFLAEQEPTR